MYEIIYRSNHGLEVIDTADTKAEAMELVSEYKMAFKSDNIYYC